MNHDKAFVLLESVLQRLEAKPTEHGRTLEISSNEIEALRYAIAVLGAAAAETVQSEAPEPRPAPPAQGQGDRPSHVAPPRSAPRAPVVRPPRKANFDDKRLGAPDPNLTLCLDFGTARSKAFATMRQGNQVDYVELGLGRRAKEPFPYPLTSTAFVTDEGRIFLGEQGYNEHERQQRPNRERLDSLKQQISQGDQQQLRRHLSAEENPFGAGLTYGDVLSLYLAYLTDMAESELEAQGLPRHARRRFAIPAWDQEKLNVMAPLLKTYLARAQVLADTFRGEWSDGIRVEDLQNVLKDISEHESRIPLSLVGEAVLEPIAAGNGRLRSDTLSRQMVLVVDVGAGTTDFALFMVTERPDDDHFVVSPLDGSVTALRMAGDTMDGIVRHLIINHAKVDPHDPASRILYSDLSRKLRRYKERLFAEKKLDYQLSDDRRGTVTLAQLLETEQAKSFEKSLKDKVQELLLGTKDNVKLVAEAGLRVLLSGGGATLPMVQSLASGTSYIDGSTLRHRSSDLLPESLRQLPFREAYPELAVALGGAMPDLPKVGSPVKLLKGIARPTVRAVRPFAG